MKTVRDLSESEFQVLYKRTAEAEPGLTQDELLEVVVDRLDDAQSATPPVAVWRREEEPCEKSTPGCSVYHGGGYENCEPW